MEAIEKEDFYLSNSSGNEGVSDSNNSTENLTSISTINKMDPIEDLKIPACNFEKIRKERNLKILESNHPLMVKYQNDLKERLSKLLQETDDQVVYLQRTISTQEKENQHLAERGYDFQKELKQQEEKLLAIQLNYEKQIEKKNCIQSKCINVKNNFQLIEENWKSDVKKDEDLQKTLEDIAFEVIQLSALRMESFTDAKSLQRAVEKTAKDKEQLEIQKLRQDLLISRIDNARFNLEDKINFYKTQWGIKKEEASDLRKELNAANVEMETIHFEKQQIVHQWKQSLAALEKHDRVLAGIRDSVGAFEDDNRTLNMDIFGYKKELRKEFERNEHLIFQQQLRESDIARVDKDLKNFLERENDLSENLSVMDKTVEITEQELKILLENKRLNEKDLETKEKLLQNIYTHQKTLEKMHMERLHEKITITKASKYTEKLIKELRNSIRSNEEEGLKKENEKEKLLLKLDNLRIYINNLEKTLSELQEERRERAILVDKSEVSALNVKEKIECKRVEVREVDNKLNEIINKAGGQELAPFERELANLRKEITVAEQGNRKMETEYLVSQQQLFTLNKQSSIKAEENDFFVKKIAVVEGKKLQIEADITKEEKDIKEAKSRLHNIISDAARINNILKKRKELQDTLLKTTELSKNDFLKILKEKELRYLLKQSALKMLRRKKKKLFKKLLQSQQRIVYWEGKVHLAEETRKMLTSDSHFSELYSLKREIKRLQLKQEQIKREQDKLVQDMKIAVYKYTNLYVEADKQSIFGKRRPSPEYIKKRIKYARKKVQEEKKVLEVYLQQIESLKSTESEIDNELDAARKLAFDLRNKIKLLKDNIYDREQDKRQDVLKLSFKQKKSKFLQKVLDKSYVRALRNETQRLGEIGKLQDGLRAIQIISQSVMNEYQELEKSLKKIIDYITVSKQI